jgi:hypothetical protein
MALKSSIVYEKDCFAGAVFSDPFFVVDLCVFPTEKGAGLQHDLFYF